MATKAPFLKVSISVPLEVVPSGNRFKGGKVVVIAKFTYLFIFSRTPALAFLLDLLI